ncbi:MAG TPA: hypothetical protein VGG51_00040 [Candidatus Cybelea sp.]
MNNALPLRVLAICSLVAAADCSGFSGGGTLTPDTTTTNDARSGKATSERARIKQFDDLVAPRGYYNPAAVTVGPDGALWVTDDTDQDYGESAVVRVLPSGKRSKTYFYYGPVSEGSGLDAITTGSDGALWLADSFNRQILRLSTSGTFTGFPLKHFESPRDITSGPDGALWFTAQFDSTAQVGRITTSGQITTYDVGEGANGITGGPDNALWFCEAGIDTIGRITVDGTVTNYSKGITPGSQPTSIAVGPDGALWFTESAGGRIGRITTSGKVTEYSGGITAADEPSGITAGPDGAMWFTEYENYQSYSVQNSKIGRITLQGAITQYALANPASEPTGIALGRKGDLWFVETGTNELGRVRILKEPQ